MCGHHTRLFQSAPPEPERELSESEWRTQRREAERKEKAIAQAKCQHPNSQPEADWRGRKRRLCLDCDKRFFENGEKVTRALTPTDVMGLRECYERGIPKKTAAVILGRNVFTVGKYYSIFMKEKTDAPVQ